ncbi:MFS general substrate transporter [Lophium mytilinum]|uniref:MFS general substrate transporter n=1 Tax=Lophium mytilinum TaxID=390894 RepID=A0A6A6QJR5_9PEZI|nr:MFS general substrate transporter [Lophium mytilinum]
MAFAKSVTIHDQTNILPTRQLLIVFGALATAFFTSYFDSNSIGVALPRIGKDLHCASTVLWAGTSAWIANTVVQPLVGRFSDIFGRKVVIVASLAILALGDLLCGLAKTGPQFYAFRGIAGIGNGGITALCMIIVSDVVTIEKRGKYQGILGACVGLGNSLGPLIAAHFAEHSSWRHTFFLLCPLAVTVGCLLIYTLPAKNMPKQALCDTLRKIDYAGIVLSTAGTILILIPVAGLGSEFKATSPLVISMLTLGGICMVLFIINERKFAPLPMIPGRLFGTLPLGAMFTQNFLIGAVYFSELFFLPVYFQSVRRWTDAKAAALIIPLVISQSTGSALSGQYSAWTGRNVEVIWFGFVCWTTGAGLHYLFDRTTSVVTIVIVLILTGFGVGCIFQPTLVLAQNQSPSEDRAVCVTTRNYIRALGASAGMAIGTGIFSNALRRNIPRTLSDSMTRAILDSIFAAPPLDGLLAGHQDEVLGAYLEACRSVFIFWSALIAFCLCLCIFIKDGGLKKKLEKEEEGRKTCSKISCQATIVQEVRTVGGATSTQELMVTQEAKIMQEAEERSRPSSPVNPFGDEKEVSQSLSSGASS